MGNQLLALNGKEQGHFSVNYHKHALLRISYRMKKKKFWRKLSLKCDSTNVSIPPRLRPSIRYLFQWGHRNSARMRRRYVPFKWSSGSLLVFQTVRPFAPRAFKFLLHAKLFEFKWIKAIRVNREREVRSTNSVCVCNSLPENGRSHPILFPRDWMIASTDSIGLSFFNIL